MDDGIVRARLVSHLNGMQARYHVIYEKNELTAWTRGGLT